MPSNEAVALRDDVASVNYSGSDDNDSEVDGKNKFGGMEPYSSYSTAWGLCQQASLRDRPCGDDIHTIYFLSQYCVVN